MTVSRRVDGWLINRWTFLKLERVADRGLQVIVIRKYDFVRNQWFGGRLGKQACPNGSKRLKLTRPVRKILGIMG